MNVSYTRFETGPDVTDHNATGAILTRGTATFDHNHFLTLGKGISVQTISTSTITNNVCEGLTNDFVTLNGPDNLITDNFCFNWAPKAGNHVDFVQHLGIQSGASYALGSELRNISVRNKNPVLSTGSDAQGLFNDDTVPPFHITGATIRNNLINQTLSNGVTLTYVDSPTVSFNTGLQVIGSTNPSVLSSHLTVTAGKGGTGGTFTKNIFNATVLLSQIGPITNTLNAVLPAINGNYLSVFPSYIQGNDIGLVNRAAAIAMFHPAIGLVLTGNTHSSTLIDGISSTAGVSDGMAVNGAPVTYSDTTLLQQVYVVSHTSTSITLSIATNTTTTGVSIGLGAEAPDGSYLGALFPANDFGEVCWNDGSVWDHTAHCTPAT